MKNKSSLKGNENNEQKKYKKCLTKYNTEYNKNKNILASFVSKKNIIPKLKEEKEEITKNKSNINIMNIHQNLRMKKYLTNVNDKLNYNLKMKTNIDSNKNGVYPHRKSINFNKNNTCKNMTKQLYINEIIPNSNKIFVNHIKNSFIRSNNFNTYHRSPDQNNRDSNISANSHSQKKNNHRKIINGNFNDKNIKFLKKNNTELNKNYNTINYNRSSSKSNKNIKNINNLKNKNLFSSSSDKQKNYSSLVMRSNLNSSMNQRNSTLSNKINYEIYKKVNMFELDYDLENNISEINYTIGNLNSNDFALCNSNSSLEDIYRKLIKLCKEKGLTLAKIESNKFICKQDGDNSIKIEINKRGKTNVLKLYYLNGKEVITKEIIREIILRIGF